MATPETTAKTEGPMLGTSSILGANDSILNNTSTYKKNNTLTNEQPIKKLSNYISRDINKIFLEKNKSALQDYEKFLKVIKRNNTISKKRKNNFIDHYYKSPYKENPKLIIASYNTKILGNNEVPINKKYKVDIVGVDEGYIHLPPFNHNEFGRILSEQDNYDYDENKNINENLEIPKITNNNSKNKKIIIKLKDKDLNISKDLTKKKRKKKKKINLTESDRGVEFISNIGLTQDENEMLNNKKNNYEKMREDFEALNTYKYEIKKLENWDFEHCQRDKMRKYISKEKISKILKNPENSQMKWYIDIKNDKKQLKLMCRNKHLKEFFNKIEQEQKVIYLQSCSIKKDFNFDIFNNKYEIKNEEKEENKKMRQIEFYKEVMREKLKVEEMFHSELTNCAEEVHLYRIKKKEATIELYGINLEINEVLQKEQNVKKIYERNMSKMHEYNDVLSILKMNIDNNKNNDKNKSPKKEKKDLHSKTPKIKQQLLNAIKLENINNEHKRQAMRRGSILMDTKKMIENKKEKKYKFNLEKLDLTAFNEKADLFQLQSDLLAQKNEIENIFRKQMSKIAEEKNNLEIKFKDKKSEIKDLTALYKKAKSNLDLRIQTLSGYYYQILKKGIDVRKNGLTWIVVKLMELRVYVDKHYFPLYLDDEEMSYILRVGVKIHELNELIKLFQLLKEKQKILRDKHINDEINKEKEFQSNDLLELLKKSKRKIGNNYAKYIEDIQIKYENVINICLNENREEANINKIKNDLKEQILKTKYEDECELLNEPELYFIPGTLAAFFAQDKRFRQYFDDIFYLNEEINKRKKDILEEKENQMKRFRIKYDIDERFGKTSNKTNEKIYAALFGNGISL